jgi:hypothetical protein
VSVCTESTQLLNWLRSSSLATARLCPQRLTDASLV